MLHLPQIYINIFMKIHIYSILYMKKSVYHEPTVHNE